MKTYPKTSTLNRLSMLLMFLIQSIVFVFGQPSGEEIKNDSTKIVISLSDLPGQIEIDARKTKDLFDQASDSLVVDSYKNSIADLDTSVRKVKEQSEFFLRSYARPWLIQNLNVKWIRLNDDWVDLSTKISTSTENNEKRLRACQEMKLKWVKIQTEISTDSVSLFLSKQISELVNNLELVEQLLNKKIKYYFLFQEKIASNRAEVNKYIETLAPLRNQDFAAFFKRDDEFLWRRSGVGDSTSLDTQMVKSVQFASGDTIEYLKSSIGKVVFVFILSGLLLYLFLKNSNKVHKKVEGQTSEASQNGVIRFPFTYAYMFTLLFALLFLTNRPPILTELLLLLFTLALATRVVKQSKGIVRVLTSSFIILYWIDFLTDLFIINPLISSYIDLIIAIVTTVLLFHLYKSRKLVKSQFPRLNNFFLKSLAPGLLVMNLLSIVLLITGFTNLSRALTTGTINFIYLAPVIIICSLSLQDLFHNLENAPFVKYSNLAKNYYYLIFRGIKLGTLYLLFVSFLASFTLTTLFQKVWLQIWNFGGQFGEFNITVGDVLEFFIIIFISWVISVVLRVLLTDEILSRTNLQRGVPMAIGVIVRYTIVFLGFILAVASTGFDLTKISILAGGLGVGIGFGLQHLVANFIAGLILIFERPIIVGDTVESEQIEGEVKQIGIRASKILTYDGAEVIIPNSNLINNKLSNWTLSNHSRRQLIVVRTSVKADPDKILEILNRIARQHENVLATPEPFVLFEGQLDQSLQFKVYYWLISDIFKTRCELNLQIYRELKEIGVELPIPVYDVRRNSEKNSTEENLAVKD